jgi:hypothetical protein
VAAHGSGLRCRSSRAPRCGRCRRR